jgi:hypothetical protein
MPHRTKRGLIARAAALAFLAHMPFAAHAGANARLQVVHASPYAPSVDVLANGSIALVTSLSFPSASATQDVTPGTYDIDVVPFGGTVADSVLSLPGVTLDAGTEYVVAAFRPPSRIAPIVYTRTASAVPAGSIRVRAVHAADGVGEVDILAITGGTQGLPLFSDLAEGTVTIEADVPAAAYRIGLDTNNDLNAEFVFDLPALASGTVVDAYAIYATGNVFLLAVFPDGTEQLIDPVPFSRVQVVHASPDAPAVDVLANGAVALFSNQSFPGATPTIGVQSGTYDLDVVPAGGTVGDSVLSLPRTTLAPGIEYVVAAFRPLSRIAPIVYTRTTAAPAPGTIRVRAVHAADGVGEVDILAVGSGNTGTALFRDLAEGAATLEATLPAGAYRVGIDTNNDSAAEFVFDLPSLAAGTVVDAYAINDGGDVFLLAVFPDGTEARIDPTPLADVRALHLSADGPNVDIFANGGLFAGNLPYLGSTGFAKLAAGATDVAIAPAGSGIGEAVLTIDGLGLAANKSTTLVAYDKVASLKALAIVENFDGLTTGSIRLNVAHTATGVPPVDLLALGDENTTPTVLLSGVPFGAVAALPDIPAGAYRLGLDAGPDGQIDFTFDVPELAGGTFANVFAVNDGGDVYLVAQFRDSSTAVIPPVKRTVDVADYESGPQGWTFASPAQFTAPQGSFTTGSLTLTTTDNTNTFGFWESPLIDVGQTVDAPEADRLIQVTAEIASSGAPANLLPVRRIRTASESWRRSDVSVITSEREGAYSVAGAYTHFGVIPADENRFRISVDVLNFDATDAITSTSDIRRIETTLVSVSLLGEGESVANVDLRGQNPVGFAPNDVAPVLKAPLFSAGANGLTIAGDPASTTPGTTFGAYTAAVGLPLAADTVYRIDWTVTSDSATAATVPTFRLRVNDSTLQGAWYANIASAGEGQLSPAGAPRTYSAYFRTPATLVGSTWLLSFDFLNTPEDGDTVTTGLTLQQLTITSHPIP